ncbi:hypothetical protein BHM03_00005723 [Ensete ventricosum]|nr:hypothetical protein BHM03_00005723 [Ensete ventricosum]
MTVTRTARYQAISPIETVFALLPPEINRQWLILIVGDQFRAVSAEEGRKKKREKKNLESPDSSTASDFFSLHGKKKRLPAWGEGTR